jgi:hypothetical protein
MILPAAMCQRGGAPLAHRLGHSGENKQGRFGIVVNAMLVIERVVS